MKITKELIKAEKPCTQPYIELLEKYGNRFEVTYEQLLNDFPQYNDWIKQRLYKYRDKLSSHYKGQFKLNQLVYRQQYGIGSYTISRIDAIEDNINGEGCHFMVTAYQEQDKYNCVEEDSLFTTLDELKLYWHKKIDEVK